MTQFVAERMALWVIHNGGFRRWKKGEGQRELILQVWGLSPQRSLGAEPLVRWSEGRRGPLKLKAFWQSCAEFPIKYFVFLSIFHVYMLHLVCDLHALNRNVVVLATAMTGWEHGRIAVLPWIRQWSHSVKMVSCIACFTLKTWKSENQTTVIRFHGLVLWWRSVTLHCC